MHNAFDLAVKGIQRTKFSLHGQGNWFRQRRGTYRRELWGDDHGRKISLAGQTSNGYSLALIERYRCSGIFQEDACGRVLQKKLPI
jgi:hypothetical protein